MAKHKKKFKSARKTAKRLDGTPAGQPLAAPQKAAPIPEIKTETPTPGQRESIARPEEVPSQDRAEAIGPKVEEAPARQAAPEVKTPEAIDRKINNALESQNLQELSEAIDDYEEAFGEGLDPADFDDQLSTLKAEHRRNTKSGEQDKPEESQKQDRTETRGPKAGDSPKQDRANTEGVGQSEAQGQSNSSKFEFKQFNPKTYQEEKSKKEGLNQEPPPFNPETAQVFTGKDGEKSYIDPNNISRLEAVTERHEKMAEQMAVKFGNKWDPENRLNREKKKKEPLDDLSAELQREANGYPKKDYQANKLIDKLITAPVKKLNRYLDRLTLTNSLSLCSTGFLIKVSNKYKKDPLIGMACNKAVKSKIKHLEKNIARMEKRLNKMGKGMSAEAEIKKGSSMKY